MKVQYNNRGLRVRDDLQRLGSENSAIVLLEAVTHEIDLGKKIGSDDFVLFCKNGTITLYCHTPYTTYKYTSLNHWGERDTPAVLILGVCTAVRMSSMAAEPQIIPTASRTVCHVRGWLPVPGDPSSHLTNMVLG